MKTRLSAAVILVFGMSSSLVLAGQKATPVPMGLNVHAPDSAGNSSPPVDNDGVTTYNADGTVSSANGVTDYTPYSAQAQAGDTPAATSAASSPQDNQQKAAAQSCNADLEAQSGILKKISTSPDQKLGKICQGALNSLIGTLNSCESKAKMAAGLCLTSQSPILQAAIPILSMGLDAISGMTDASAICKKQSALMTIAKDALTAYNAACAGVKIMCDSSCGSIDAAIASAKTKCQNENAALNTQSAAAQMSANITLADQLDAQAFGDMAVVVATAGSTPPAKECQKVCGSYGLNLMAGGAGILSMLMSGKQAQSCTAATTTPVAGLDCTQAANASNQTCICMANPNASGCATATNSVGTPTTGVAVGTTPPPLSGGGGLGDPSLGASPALGSGGSSAGGAPGGGSGGGGMSGVGGSPSGAKPNPLVAAKDPLNAGAGGGGGGFSGGVGNGWNDGTAAGGAGGKSGKDLKNGRAPASDVSGKAGKSNWDKVNKTYLEKSPTFLNKN